MLKIVRVSFTFLFLHAIASGYVFGMDSAGAGLLVGGTVTPPPGAKPLGIKIPGGSPERPSAFKPSPKLGAHPVRPDVLARMEFALDPSAYPGHSSQKKVPIIPGLLAKDSLFDALPAEPLDSARGVAEVAADPLVALRKQVSAAMMESLYFLLCDFHSDSKSVLEGRAFLNACLDGLKQSLDESYHDLLSKAISSWAEGQVKILVNNALRDHALVLERKIADASKEKKDLFMNSVVIQLKSSSSGRTVEAVVSEIRSTFLCSILYPPKIRRLPFNLGQDNMSDDDGISAEDL